jgi:precorrin-2 dehydrogenase/sirohydrochlorin ferrochelatase
MSSAVRCAYPMMLDVSSRPVVIIGGGTVAARKAKGLLEAGATRVSVVAPDICGAMPDGVERIPAPYDRRYLTGAGLVFAATDDAGVNAAIVRDAHALGILVNRADADDEAPGNFSTPAVIRAGDLVVTVSAGGSPALAAAVRDALKTHVSPKWVAMSAAMQELRPRIHAAGAPIEERRRAFRDLATDEAMDVLATGGVDALWDWLAHRNRDA